MALSEGQKKKLLRAALAMVVIGHFGAFALLSGGLGTWRLGEIEVPPQPIAFPHTIHAGQLGLECTFCHIHADSARSAGVPPLSKCMSCHRQIATESPEIQKLTQHWENREPVAWVRLHQLPDFIYFSHKRHVRAGVDCFACHGPVAAMAEVRPIRPLKMGFCVTCHKVRKAPMDCWTCHL